jgi:acyl carrier protein
MLTTDQVRDFVVGRLAKKMTKLGITPDDTLSLTETGLLDSFGLLEMVMAVQAAFGVTVDVSDVDPERVTTLGGFSEIIASTAQPSSTTT